MKSINEIVQTSYSKLDYLGDFVLLAIRLMLAYLFLEPAMMKIQHFGYIVTWFGPNGLDLPLPYLNAFLATATEALGVILLTLGLFTRFIALPLIIVMIVAIVTVHNSGFALVKELAETHYVFLHGELQFETKYQYLNGYEKHIYYILMLLVMTAKGAGKYSLDNLYFRRS